MSRSHTIIKTNTRLVQYSMTWRN